VLVGLALFLTVVITQPVAMEIYSNAWAPLERGEITSQVAMDRGSAPMKTFLARFVREKDVRLFVEVAHAPAPKTPADLDLRVLIPAYILSELKTDSKSAPCCSCRFSSSTWWSRP
jgi:flagellar biosynthetic protein FliP